MTEPLLPCPFCGGKAEINNDTGPNDESYWEWIECEDCGARTNSATWNRRAADPALAGLIGAIEEARKKLAGFEKIRWGWDGPCGSNIVVEMADDILCAALEAARKGTT